MKADNSHHLLKAAEAKAKATREKVQQALRELDRDKAEITFTAVAAAAGVSRSYLYTDEEIKAEIERLRGAQRSSGQQRPTIQRSSDASLHQRIRVLLDRNKELTEENQKLREALANTLRR